MDRLKRLFFALVRPHTAVVTVLIPLSVIMLLYPLIAPDAYLVLTVAGYALSAYTLAIVCVRIPDIIAGIKDIKNNNKIVRRYFDDPILRVKLSLWGTFVLNVAYALMQLGLGFRHSSAWYLSLSAYYILIAVSRFGLLRHVGLNGTGVDRRTELVRYRITAIFLLFINSSIGAMIFYMLFDGVEIVHHEITAIAMAAYTFTAVTLSVVNIVKYRKYNNPVFSAAKAVSLAAALVSVISLENSMITAFGTPDDGELLSIITAVSGGVITALLLAMSVYIIVKTTKEIRLNGKQQLV